MKFLKKKKKKRLNEGNFGLHRDIWGEVWAKPAWAHCLEYEHQLREEALRLCFEKENSIQDELRLACDDPQQRIKHWIQLLAVANSTSATSDADKEKIAALVFNVAELEGNNRSQPPTQRTFKGTGKGTKNKGGPLTGYPGPRRRSERKRQRQNRQRQGEQWQKAQGKPNYIIGTGSRSGDFMDSTGALQRYHSGNRHPPGFCHNFQANMPQADCLRLEEA